MARTYSKKVRKLLREFWREAYERELHSELTKLDEGFSEWREGRISSGELSHRIHRYETGPSRKLYKTYNDGERDLMVASAIVSGILDRDEVPDVLLEALAGPINFWASMEDDQGA